MRCINDTGKNDLTRRVTHREAVFGPAIHSIFDAWHYEIIWTCNLTRLLWCAWDYGRLILYITAYNKRQSKLPDAFHCTLPSTLLIALDCTLTACFTVRSQLLSMAHSQPAWLTLSSKLSRRSQVHSWACSQGRSQLLSMANSNLAWQYALKTLSSTLPRTLSRTLPTALDGTLPACMTVRSQVSSQEALKHTPEHALKDTPNCSRWHTPILLDCTLSRRSQAHSQERSQGCSQLHSMAHSQPA